MKRCRKDLHFFTDNLPRCPECRIISQKLWYSKNVEHALSTNQTWYTNNIEKRKDSMRLYKQGHIDEIAAYKKVWQQENVEIVKEKLNIYRAKRLSTDLSYKIAKNLRSRFNRAIKGNYKSGSAVDDLGCSIEEFKRYLESKFQPGMTWDNYGRKGWHIDHILPISRFDLSERDQVLIVCHYINLQPMWAKDNLRKGSK